MVSAARRPKKNKAPRPGEVPFMGCVRCKGGSGKERRSAGSATCRDGTCRRLHAEDRKGAKAPDAALSRGLAEMEEQDASYLQMLASRVCCSIVQVFAVSFVGPDPSALSMHEHLNGVAADKPHYLVRGGFGAGCIGETYLNGTRWVSLYELMRHCTTCDVEKLAKFDKALTACAGEARRDVQELIDKEEAEEAEAEAEAEDADEDEGEDEDADDGGEAAAEG